MNSRIPGKLDCDALAMLLGEHPDAVHHHRPDEVDALRRAALDLAGRGWLTDDIAAALGLTRAAVKVLLAEASQEVGRG